MSGAAWWAMAAAEQSRRTSWFACDDCGGAHRPEFSQLNAVLSLIICPATPPDSIKVYRRPTP